MDFHIIQQYETMKLNQETCKPVCSTWQISLSLYPNTKLTLLHFSTTHKL